MDLLIELVKLATAMVALATVVKKAHTEIADDSRADEKGGRES